ncbi:hypothetical protein CHUAL_002778 [Chamberlinius hualienensis]
MAFGCSLLQQPPHSANNNGGEPNQLVHNSSLVPVASGSGTNMNQQQQQRESANSQYSLLCPRLSNSQQQQTHHHHHHHLETQGVAGPWWKSLTKKYVILCCICGGSAVLLGIIFISIYFTLHYYTSSLQYFETIPTYAPAVVLIITGILVMCFSRRRNRYAYLIKLAGGCCLVCAVLCVVITVTTTVIHMNRLQTLRECVYTQKSKMCTCFAGIGDDEGSAKYIFNNTPDCEVVHGSLYTCLRAMFGLSVIGILVCIFSSMLVYQLLSHEKKKMYWEQLEMRRRFYYRQPSHPLYCNCYDDYGFAAATAPPPPPHHDLYTWQPWEISSDRCWPMRGITPRHAFAGEEGGGAASQRSILVGSTGHRASGWNWLPWSRNRERNGSNSNLNSSSPLNNSSINNNEQLAAVGNINHNDFDNERHVNRVQNNLNDESSPRLPSFGTVHPYWSAVSAETRFNGTNSSRRNGGRRRRSNDAVFHHLSMTPPTRYQSPFCVTEAGYAPPISFSTYNSLSRHMWGPPPPYSQQSSVENVVDSNTLNRSIHEQTAPPHLRHYFRTVSSVTGVGTGIGIGREQSGSNNHQQQQQTELQTIESNDSEPISDVKIYSNDLVVRVNNASTAPVNRDLCKTSLFSGKTMISEGTSTLPNLQHYKDEEVEEATVYTSKSASYLPPKLKSRPIANVWPSSKRPNNVFIPNSCSSSSNSRSSSSSSSSCNSSRSTDSSGESFEIESDYRSSVLASTSSTSDSNNDNGGFATDILCVRSLPNLNLSSVVAPKKFQLPSKPLLPPPPPPQRHQHQHQHHRHQHQHHLPPPNTTVQPRHHERKIPKAGKVSVPVNKINNPVKTESFPTLPLGVTLVNVTNSGFYVKRNDYRAVDYVEDGTGTKSKSAGTLPLPSTPSSASSPPNDIIFAFKSVHV